MALAKENSLWAMAEAVASTKNAIVNTAFRIGCKLR
jgi:hypothetical protein